MCEKQTNKKTKNLLLILLIGLLTHWVGILYTYTGEVFSLALVLWIFSHSCGWRFHFLNSIFQGADVSNFDEVQFIHSFLIWLVSCLRNICLPSGCESVHLIFFFPRNSLVLTFMFRSSTGFWAKSWCDLT